MKKSRYSGCSLTWCATQQIVKSIWSPQIQDDLWCDVQHSRLWAAADEVHKFRTISDVRCNTAACEQQMKKSTNSGWSLMWGVTQQPASSSWRSPQIQVYLWCDVQHSRLWAAAEVQKFRAISHVVCNKDGWEAVKCWHLLVLSSLPSHTWTEWVTGSSKINYSSESASKFITPFLYYKNIFYSVSNKTTGFERQ
jgi:hypothetical protein